MVEALAFVVLIFFNDYYASVASRTKDVRLNFMPRFTIETKRSPFFILAGYVLVLKLKKNDQNNRSHNPFLHWCKVVGGL